MREALYKQTYLYIFHLFKDQTVTVMQYINIWNIFWNRLTSVYQLVVYDSQPIKNELMGWLWNSCAFNSSLWIVMSTIINQYIFHNLKWINLWDNHITMHCAILQPHTNLSDKYISIFCIPTAWYKFVQGLICCRCIMTCSRPKL